MKHVFLFFIILLSISCSKEKAAQHPIERTSTKTIDFFVYTLKDFSDPRFDNLKVSIDLAVKKVLRRDRTLISTLWDTTINKRPTKEYPYTIAAALRISKQFSGIKGSTEQINVLYSTRWVKGNLPPSYSTLVNSA